MQVGAAQLSASSSKLSFVQVLDEPRRRHHRFVIVQAGAQELNVQALSLRAASWPPGVTIEKHWQNNIEHQKGHQK